MISNKHGVNVRDPFSDLITADESRNIQFINGTKKMEEFLLFADYTYLVSG